MLLERKLGGSLRPAIKFLRMIALNYPMVLWLVDTNPRTYSGFYGTRAISLGKRIAVR